MNFLSFQIPDSAQFCQGLWSTVFCRLMLYSYVISQAQPRVSSKALSETMVLGNSNTMDIFLQSKANVPKLLEELRCYDATMFFRGKNEDIVCMWRNICI
jgi:hypothetical protein